MDSQKSELDLMKNNGIMDNNKGLCFETVFIVEGDYEIIHPKSSITYNSSEQATDMNCNVNEVQKSDTKNLNEEYVRFYPSNSKNAGQESKTSKSTGNHSSLHTNFGCFAMKKPNNQGRNQSYSFMEETIKESNKLTSHASPRNKKEPETMDSHFNNTNNPSQKMKMLKFQQKVRHLNKELSRIDHIVKTSKKVLSIPKNASRNNLNLNNCTNNTMSNVSAARLKEGPQTTTGLTQLEERDFNIDFLKGQIIKASQTLIKTEKSLKVLKKLLHKDVVVEKETATKYLKDFQYTVNTFRKAIKHIDRNVLTQYRHLVPSNDSDQTCEFKST